MPGYMDDDGAQYASDNRWRHQESGSFLRHADKRSSRPQSMHQIFKTPSADGKQQGDPRSQDLRILCGPLLNYRRSESDVWYGSVLIVTYSGAASAEVTAPPELEVIVTRARKQHADESQSGEVREDHSASTTTEDRFENFKARGIKLYSDSIYSFWRFSLEIPMQQFEIQCQYSISGCIYPQGKRPVEQKFYVPAISKSMRIMFHSCNGFSVGTDEEAFSGACLWNDVFREHERMPFHVMIGGGDQIYNDGIRVDGPLNKWTRLTSPRERELFKFSERLRRKCDKYYLNNYIKWFATEPFASCNCQIPQLNIWDDHDIIDGFGSYVDTFMNCPVFKGIGGVANKYYLLFQHHLAPPPYSFTSDIPEITTSSGVGVDPNQLKDTFVLRESSIDSSYIIGAKPGPYLKENSRSIYTRLGARIAFLGIDGRTERTRTQVNYPETYDLIFRRVTRELEIAKNSPTPIQHLVVLLGIPIAYPRLTWLENIFRSPVIGFVKLLHKRYGCGGSIFNHFDGNVDLLDDLDDHYTARGHKKERLFLVTEFQKLAERFSVRVSILSGDVHLAAVGRFYSSPDLEIPVAEDHRYMVNIISSAIVNKPPPQAVANLIALRNKIHHLDEYTDETLINFFDREPGKSTRTYNLNRVTMPRRNWAMMTENHANPRAAPRFRGANIGSPNPSSSSDDDEPDDGIPWLPHGEARAGTRHRAADPARHGHGDDGGLDVCIRVEIDQHDGRGMTDFYGMTIPALSLGAAQASPS